MKTLFVIDASGYLYRSYFAIRNITNAKGESTNALFGFIRSLHKLRKDFHPEHLVAVFDGPHSIKPRRAIYAEYKAQRATTPPDLVYQIKWAQQACELMGIPYIALPEVEADDTMGSVAVWAAKQDAKVYLCTSDKDLCQLVNDKIVILNTHKENLILGPKEVEETYGVPPKQIVDWLAITGDSSDNVPGLPGFGPKTATTLLKEFGSLDYILKHPEVAGKKQEVLIQHKEQALISQRLVTLHTDLHFPKERDFFALKHPQLQPLKEFYSSMNFNSLLRELEQLAGEPSTTQEKEESYTLVDEEQEIKHLLEKLSTSPKIALSTKSTHSQPIKGELVGISFAAEPHTAWYLPANGKVGLTRLSQLLKPFLENPKHRFYGHDIKRDYHVLKNHGITLGLPSFDTMLASYLLHSHLRQHSLDYLTLETFGKAMPLETDLLGKGKKALSLHEVPPEKVVSLACTEADYICRLKEVLSERLRERNLVSLFQELELPLLIVLANMEQQGIYLDVPHLQTMSKEILKQIKTSEESIYALAEGPFNINSPKQVADILFTKMGIKPPKKTATGLSTSAEVLESLQKQYPIAGKILEYRMLEKLRSTYIDALPLEVYPKTERIHCTFNQTVAATGRLSCQDPNLQNIPIRTEIGRKIREAFRPQKEGWSYLGADYSQIELRLLAHLSEDSLLMEAFHRGDDVHAHTASLIFHVPREQVTSQLRHQAKAVNFGIVFGQQAFGLAQGLGIDVKDAAIFIDAYFKQYPKVKTYLDKSRELAQKTGKAVTYTGRERLIPEIHSKNGMLRMAAERLAINTPLQGTAADLIKMAMVQIDNALKARKLHSYMVLQIHDELIFECPDSELEEMQSLVKELMQNVLKLKIPLIVDIAVGKNWAAC